MSRFLRIAKVAAAESDKSGEVFALATLSAEPAGLAEAPPHLTLPGSVLGTPNYLSPEQARGGTIDFSADQYSLGCILYELLTGRVPFTDTTLLGLLRKHMTEPPQPLTGRAADPKISPTLESLVLRLLSKVPAGRFASMQEVAQALEQELAGPGRPPRRFPTALVAILGGSLLVGGAVFSRLGGVPQSELTTEPEPTLAALAAARQQAIAVFKKQLGDPGQQQAALAALSQCRDTTLVEPVMALLASPDLDLAAQAAATLGQLGDRRPVATLRRLLPTAPLRLRLSIARALTDLDDEAGRRTLAELLHSTDPATVPAETRLHAAFLLCDTDEPAAQRLLVQLADLSTTQNSSVLDILTCLGRSPAAGPARQKLLARFASLPGPAKLPVAARLAQLGEAAGRDFLRELAARPGPDQLAAARALAAPDEPALAPLFRRTLRARTDGPTRLLATAGLGLSGELRDVSGLGQQLTTATDPGLRRTTAVAILSICEREPTSLSENSLRWVQQAVEDPSWVVRADAVAALAHSDSGAAVLLLGRLLGDGIPAVRKRAAQALGWRREHSALLALRAGLTDPDPSVRTEVLTALARLGSYLRRQGLGGVWQELASWLATDDPRFALPERQKSALLLILGDESQRARLAMGQENPQPDEQRFLLDLGLADRSWLLTALRSSEFSVRLAAAGRLAQQHDASGRAVLAEAVQRGGALAITAYGMLARLGEAVSMEPLLAGLSASSPLADRLAVVAMAAALPLPGALALWQKAIHDPDRVVRRATVAAIAQEASAAQAQQAMPILLLLLNDSDPGTRAQAAALLARLLHPAGSPAGTAAASARGIPVADADGGGTDGSAATPADLGRGPPDSGSVTPDAGIGLVGSAVTAPVEQALREALLAGKQKDYARAQKLFLRTRALCAALHPAPERCRSLVPEATWQLAQLYDQQERLPEAMAEYQHLAQDRKFASLDLTRQLLVQKAIVRLSLRLGQVVISSQVGTRCRKEVQWLVPGSRTITVAGQPKLVTVEASQRQEVGSCP